MVKTLQLLIVLLILSSQLSSFAQSIILPGTRSNRLDENSQPTNTYYGAPEGAMTNWDTSPYKDFHLDNGNQNNNSLQMNFRLLFPNGYDLPENDSKKYPMILMLHGAGESGVIWPGKRIYEEDDPKYLNNDHQLLHGGKQHRDAVNRDPSDTRAFPGFVLYPQNKSGWHQSEIERAIKIIELLVSEYNIDQNRIYVHGLSNGAVGTWEIIAKRPDLFATGLPMSGVPGNPEQYDFTKIVHIPIWLFQGGQDNNPFPASAENRLEIFRQAGGSPRYTLYPNLGHSVWNRAYAEPDFFSWMLQYSKLTIHAYQGKTEFCEGETVNARLGISPGFAEYQWKKDGTVISEATSHELVATDYGDYAVRFKRDADWTKWSEPITISKKGLTATPSITTSGSTTLPTPDGSDSVVLYAPEGLEAYLWSNGATTSSITVRTPGRYTVRVTGSGGCQSLESEPVTVTVDGITDIATPSNLTAKAETETTISLSWLDNSDNENAFEVYRSKSETDTFKLISSTGKNAVNFNDKDLTPNTTYYYKVRGVNEQGGSEFSSVVSAKTIVDQEVPSSPVNLISTKITINSISIAWDPSSDNVGVVKYHIFVDGVLAGDTTDTTFTISGLEPEKFYTITVKAVDAAGNISDASEGLTEATVVKGLNYKLFLGGTWDKIEEYNEWPVSKEGTIENFDISIESNGGVRPDVDVDYFAFNFEGYLFIEEEGAYTFYTESDDGSKLFINEQPVVDNDSLHTTVQEKSGTVDLSIGAHTIKVQYFDRTSEEYLKVYFEGPGISKQMIPDSLFKSSDLLDTAEESEDTTDVVLDAEIPELEDFRAIVYPNPVINTLHIEFEKDNYREVNLAFIDQIGRVHFTEKKSLNQGKSVWNIPLDDKNLKPGMYFLNFRYDDGKSEYLRIIKAH